MNGEQEKGEGSGEFSLGRQTPRRRARQRQTTLRWILRFFMVAAIFAIALQRGMPLQDLWGLGVLILWALALPYVARYAWRRFGLMGLEGAARWVATGAAVVILLAVFALAIRAVLAGSLGG